MPHDMHGEHFCAVVSCDGWMFALTWNAGIKDEPAELWALVQSNIYMNAEATARKTTQVHNFWNTSVMRNRAVLAVGSIIT